MVKISRNYTSKKCQYIAIEQPYCLRETSAIIDGVEIKIPSLYTEHVDSLTHKLKEIQLLLNLGPKLTALDKKKLSVLVQKIQASVSSRG